MKAVKSATRIVAFGGGHGLSATLRALSICKGSHPENQIEITAVVGVSDDGGSSGRLRNEFPIVPPGDLRMALAALSPEVDSELGYEVEPDPISSWRQLLQYRFPNTSESGLAGHVTGNILLTALWNSGYSPVQGLQILGLLLGIDGTVLPCSEEPIEIEAEIGWNSNSADSFVETVTGQVSIAGTSGTVNSVAIIPPNPRECPEAIEAVRAADVLIFGPGSWFTSVVPHLLVPSIFRAVNDSAAMKVLLINLGPQLGETTGFEAKDYLVSWADLFPEIELDLVIADPKSISNGSDFESTARGLGISVLWKEVAGSGETHDPRLLARAFDTVMTMKRGTTWQ